MNSAEFQNVLAEALERRYASIPDPEELSFDYEFSPRFERKMKRMIRRFEHIQVPLPWRFPQSPRFPLCCIHR